MFVDHIKVASPNVTYTEDAIHADYTYQSTKVTLDHPQNDSTNTSGATAILSPQSQTYHFRTCTKLPRLGLLLVGWGGNNGSTVTAGIFANRQQLSWQTLAGTQHANYYGSIIMSSTLNIGQAGTEEVYAPLSSLVPMINPDDIVIGGWDINNRNLAEAMKEAKVIEPDLQRQLYKQMEKMAPMPSIYYPGFVATNQGDRANHLIKGNKKWNHLQVIRENIREFKRANDLDKVIVLWTANTERHSEVLKGVNDTADNLLNAIKNSHSEVAPSLVFAVAAILEGCPYINGSPQNTFVPGCIELAEREGVFVGGDDFKSGQTKFKSVIIDFLVKAGLKPKSIVSYNHLGNNDGKNLSEPEQFKSKEISKRNVIDDVVDSNRILYKKDEKPDHVVVIKYVPAVGDSKRAMDEYISEIFLGGTNTVVTHNTCEDSLLAAPLIIDLVLICELATRITFKIDRQFGNHTKSEYEGFHPVLSILSYLLKAPLVPKGTPVSNALFPQRACIENILRACVGLPPENSMRLEYKNKAVAKQQSDETSNGVLNCNGNLGTNGVESNNGVHIRK